MINQKMCEELLDGSLTHHKNYLSGFHKAYYITIDYRPQVYIVYIHATFDNLPGRAMLESFMKQHKNSMQYLTKYELKDHTVKLWIAQPKQKKTTVSVMNEIINPVISQLLACKYVTGCINCGDNDDPVDCYLISGYHHYLCEQCVKEIEDNFKIAQRSLKSLSSKIVPGIIGALLGSLIGVVLWMILYNNNLYGWLAGVLTVFGTFKGFEMLGGRMDKKGFIASVIISVLMIALGNHFAWAWSSMMTGLKEGYSYFEIFFSGKLLVSHGFVIQYLKDLILGYLFTITLGYKMIRSKYRTSIGAYTIKKCEE